MHSDARGQIFNLRAGERLPLWTDQWPDHLFIVLTHDVSTLVASAYRRVEAAEPMPGVIAVAQSTLAGVVIEDLVVVVGCSSAEDWRDQVHYLPFR